MPTAVKDESAGKKSSARLSPEELCKLAEKLVAATDPKDAERLKQELVRGWYGDEPPHA